MDTILRFLVSTSETRRARRRPSRQTVKKTHRRRELLPLPLPNVFNTVPRTPSTHRSLDFLSLVLTLMLVQSRPSGTGSRPPDDTGGGHIDPHHQLHSRYDSGRVWVTRVEKKSGKDRTPFVHVRDSILVTVVENSFLLPKGWLTFPRRPNSKSPKCRSRTRGFRDEDRL